MPLARERERELILECQAARLKGDRVAYDAAFSLLYQGLAPGVMVIARRATRKPEDADEVTNEAFSDLDDYLPKVDPDMGCFGLLRQYVFWKAADRYSNQAVILSHEESFDPEKHPDPISDKPSVEKRWIAWEAAKICLSKAERLAALVCGREAGPPHERMVFLFCRTLAFKPAQLVKENFSGRKLGVDYEFQGKCWAALEPEIESEWIRESELRPERIREMFAPLRRDMGVILSAYPLHGRTQELYGNTPLWGLQIAQGQLREYFRSDPPTEDVRKWWVNVERRLVRLARKRQ